MEQLHLKVSVRLRISGVQFFVSRHEKQLSLGREDTFFLNGKETFVFRGNRDSCHLLGVRETAFCFSTLKLI